MGRKKKQVARSAFKVPIENHVVHLSKQREKFNKIMEIERQAESKAMEKAMLYWINT